jgi:aminoglycoside 6'-N-acetyltransferase
LSSDQLQGDLVGLRPAVEADVPVLVAIRAAPEVRRWWRGDDLERDTFDSIAEEGLHFMVVEVDDHGERRVIGAIQWAEEEEPEYRHANVDMFLDPAEHNRGFGSDAVRTLCRHLFEVEWHHRITIDPAADNHAAIRCYEKVGFQKVGIMRQYERGADGSFHDGVLMDLLRGDLT